MRRRHLLLIPGLTGLNGLTTGSARAHDTRVGDLLIDHAYALPSAPGQDQGQAHLRKLSNRGVRPDRLLGASTPVAASVLLQRHGLTVPAIELPPGIELSLRHDGEWRLLLQGLKAPLLNGQRFALLLRFEQAGECEVRAWVQQPRGPGGSQH
ncbi:copper chaperone PCu(A)C [Ideonella sp. 4Y11]|uniref:Copper chaperone PCu(A)C n=1 Tax=Ideonella aquatica TaxID=2824119 RepID=A0A940YVQ5_9BURK|nr:copper chaperone PCu(A)C [Ideonella aquatica]MBQ0960130.1 copper chaperone PCu(A)C [Ideonella aquatica]